MILSTITVEQAKNKYEERRGDWGRIAYRTDKTRLLFFYDEWCFDLAVRAEGSAAGVVDVFAVDV